MPCKSLYTFSVCTKSEVRGAWPKQRRREPSGAQFYSVCSVLFFIGITTNLFYSVCSVLFFIRVTTNLFYSVCSLLFLIGITTNLRWTPVVNHMYSTTHYHECKFSYMLYMLYNFERVRITVRRTERHENVEVKWKENWGLMQIRE